LGVFAFTCAVNDADIGGTTGDAFLFGPNELSIANRMMTFVLSSYVVLMVKTYHVGVRSKSRSMMYGASRAVDTLCMTINYDHPRADQFLKTAHGAMTAIGQYALIIASKAADSKSRKMRSSSFLKTEVSMARPYPSCPQSNHSMYFVWPFFRLFVTSVAANHPASMICLTMIG
jgi:hypothetical protein